ncbi:NAD(P)-binding protein [Penicillium macrosclerotiorum]|uniref:NAD(P)-binding protein n=1 Tax=Penicillium macrosclerotiorum TaxID=303699 RepID=UPI00254987A0|nr:NAD(P)-binding protein [Penicillium macrosclerotiorum]KAJ5664643.1 NAD(P)-binding protein [Penicillium macrosclerotiorum]
MVSNAEVKASNARITEDTAPRIAVFSGGTDGIGKATLARLVATNVAVKVYVMGRNGEKHQPALDMIRRSNKQAKIIWLEGQLSLLAEIKRMCDEIKANETQIDVLYMSPGFISTGPRVETSEGIGLAQSLTYYGRMSMITHLLPLLQASSNSPRIISVLAAGYETSSIYLDDLDLKKPGHHSLIPLSQAGGTYTTLTMSKLAKENPTVVFIHHAPGGVDTGVFKKAWGNRWYWPLVGSVMSTFGTSPETAAEKILYMMTSAKYGGKGVPLVAGQSPGMTMDRTRQSGSLFLVNDKLKELQQEKVMSELKKKDAGDIVWRKTLSTMKPYL